MKGSEKQIKWATDIVKKIEGCKTTVRNYGKATDISCKTLIIQEKLKKAYTEKYGEFEGWPQEVKDTYYNKTGKYEMLIRRFVEFLNEQDAGQIISTYKDLYEFNNFKQIIYHTMQNRKEWYDKFNEIGKEIEETIKFDEKSFQEKFFIEDDLYRAIQERKGGAK